MSPFENPLEAYKQQIVGEVMALNQIQNHIKTMNRNLTQCAWDDPVDPRVQEGAKWAAQKIIGALIDNIGAAVNFTDPDFRKKIVAKSDELHEKLEGSQVWEAVKSDLRVSLIKSIRPENALGRAALIRHFDLAFYFFFNVITQAALYLINKIDIKYMAMTEEDQANFQGMLVKVAKERGAEVDVAKEDDEPEEVVDKILGKREDKN